MSEVPFSPFAIEYAVMEQRPENPPGAYVPVLKTRDRDIAFGALAGLNMQFKMRERWADTDREPTPHGVGRFHITCRLVGTRWLSHESVTEHLEALTEGLRLLDQKHGMT
jgi:hypothetical protein